MTRKQWVGFDLDGTIAEFDCKEKEKDEDYIGAPIPSMIETMRQFKKAGYDVKIFTARVYDEDGEGKKENINKWVEENGLGDCVDGITNKKDPMMVRLYDDRAVEVFRNKGMLWADYVNYILDPFHKIESKRELESALNSIILMAGRDSAMRPCVEIVQRAYNMIEELRELHSLGKVEPVNGGKNETTNPDSDGMDAESDIDLATASPVGEG